MPHAAHRALRLKNELQEIYLNQVLLHFATMLIGVFVPIYILNLGFDMVTVLLWNMIFYLSLGAFSMPFASLGSRIGLKHSILYSTPFLIAYYLSLILLGHYQLIYHMMLYPIAILGGAAWSLYWTSLNSSFIKSSDHIHRGEETAHLIAFPKLAGIAAPVIGAFILDYFGFDVLFVMVTLLVGLSVYPLFMTADKKKLFKFGWRDDMKFFLDKRFSFGLFLRGGSFIIEGIVWPIFIYVTFQDLIFVGVASALSAIGITIFTLLVGRLSDRVDKRKIVKIGGILYAVVWFMRPFVSTPLEVFLLSFLGGMFMTTIAVSLFASFSDMAKHKNILGSVVFRESWLTIGRVVALGSLVVLGMSYSFGTAFVFAGMLSLLLVLF
jgi:MFS family permease